jgi:ABC-2 type transport system permease protein
VNLLRAELIKIRATRSTWILGGIAVLFCALWTVVAVLAMDGPSPQGIRTVYQNAQQAYLFSLILGLLGMTGEYRHQTVTWSFLATPRREKVVLAKVLAHGLIVGLTVALACVLSTVVTALITLSAQGFPLTASGIGPILLGATISTTLYAMLGVALGALVRHQVAAVAIALGWFYYAEFLLIWFLPKVGQWTPGGAAKALIGWNLDGSMLLPGWAGGLVFLGYTVLFGAVAYATTTQRDIT